MNCLRCPYQPRQLMSFQRRQIPVIILISEKFLKERTDQAPLTAQITQNAIIFCNRLDISFCSWQLINYLNEIQSQKGPNHLNTNNASDEK